MAQVELTKEELGGNEYAGEVRLTNLEVPTFEGVSKSARPTPIFVQNVAKVVLLTVFL